MRSSLSLLKPIILSTPLKAPPHRYPNAQILYHSPSKFVIINKPSNVALQGQHGSEARKNWEGIKNGLFKIEGREVLGVHRLDRATTGTLLLALSPSSARTLSTLFQSHSVKRTYLAVVHSRIPAGKTGIIDIPLVINHDRVNLASLEVNGAKPAVTSWESLSCGGEGFDCSLLKLTPQTGRKHQIRAHLADVLKAPILGDYKYSPTFPHDSFADPLKIPMLLHAWKMEFHTYAKSGKQQLLSVTAPVSKHFEGFCERAGLGVEGMDDAGGEIGFTRKIRRNEGLEVKKSVPSWLFKEPE